MRALTIITSILLVVGGLNWGLVGLFEYDLVAEIVGEEFGVVNALSRIIYIAVGVAAIAHIPALIAALKSGDDNVVERRNEPHRTATVNR